MGSGTASIVWYLINYFKGEIRICFDCTIFNVPNTDEYGINIKKGFGSTLVVKQVMFRVCMQQKSKRLLNTGINTGIPDPGSELSSHVWASQYRTYESGGDLQN